MGTARTITVSFAVMFGLVILCESASGNEPAGGLIAHWKFDEGEGKTAYDSAGENDGTLVNGPLWTSGRIDGALDFDGVDDYVDLGNDNSLKPPLPVTLSAWIRFSQNGRTIIGSDDSSSAYYGMWMDINVENHATVAFGDGIGWGAPSYRRGKTGTTALSPDVWYHVVGVARGATDMSIYINGVDDGGLYSGTGGSLAYSNGNATIATSHYHDLHFEGKIDDVRLYDRALSAEEVRHLYHASFSGLIAHWKFDKGKGKTAYDSAGDNHGTIHGANWTTGKIDGALDFDGADDYVETAVLNIDTVTAAAWIYVSGDTIGDQQAILSNFENSGYGLLYDFTGNGRLAFYAHINGGYRSATSDAVAQKYQWYHVAGSYDRDNGYLYVDGVRQEDSFGDDGVITDTGLPLLIGANPDSGGTPEAGRCFNGKIDDVYIYGRALSAEEMKGLCNRSLRGRSLPIAHWKFDEGEGKTVYDSAGDNDGTIYGAQWTTGIIDGALDFDGQGDYVNCGDIDELEFGDKDFSISFWFYTEGVHDGGGGNGKIIAKYNWARGRQWAFSQKRSGSGRIYWYTSPDGTTREDLISQDGGYENEWVHVAAVRDGEIKLLYISGVLDNTGPTDGVVTGKPTSVLIGAIEDSSRRYNFFNGKIDDVRVYNRALSIEEVEQVCGKKPSGRSLPVVPMIVVNNIERAIRKQVEEWKSIDDALRKEWAAYKALEQMLQSGDYGDLSYDAILTARREINTAIQHGEKSKELLEKSIGNLEAALAALGFELVPKASAWLEKVKQTIP